MGLKAIGFTVNKVHAFCGCSFCRCRHISTYSLQSTLVAPHFSAQPQRVKQNDPPTTITQSKRNKPLLTGDRRVRFLAEVQAIQRHVREGRKGLK